MSSIPGHNPSRPPNLGLLLREPYRLGNEQLFLVKAKGGKWEKITDWLKTGS